MVGTDKAQCSEYYYRATFETDDIYNVKEEEKKKKKKKAGGGGWKKKKRTGLKNKNKNKIKERERTKVEDEERERVKVCVTAGRHTDIIVILTHFSPRT